MSRLNNRVVNLERVIEPADPEAERMAEIQGLVNQAVSEIQQGRRSAGLDPLKHDSAELKAAVLGRLGFELNDANQWIVKSVISEADNEQLKQQS